MSLFAIKSPTQLAQALVGKLLELPDGQICEITGADGFTWAENQKPVYRDLLHMGIADVFTPVVSGHPMFLIVCMDGTQIGGCVRITGLTNGPNITVEGAGRIGKFVGFSHKQTGRIIERGERPLLLHMDGSLSPQATSDDAPKKSRGKKKSAGPLPDKIVQRHMERLTIKYTRVATSTDTFDVWIQNVRTEHPTEAALNRYLNAD